MSIVAVDAIGGAKPHKALPILEDGIHRALRQPFVNAYIFKPGNNRLANAMNVCPKDEGNMEDSNVFEKGCNSQNG
jgi:hypothetical protein